MAMTPLTALEQQIEELSLDYDVTEQYSEEAVVRIFEMLERTRLPSPRATFRRSTPTSTSWTTGMFTHGRSNSNASNYGVHGQGGQGIDRNGGLWRGGCYKGSTTQGAPGLPQ